RQAHLYGISSSERAAETQTLTRSGQFQLYDATNFSFWLQATATGDRRAEAHGARATAAFEQGTHAREEGDRYIRNTILLATVLFLAALAPRFKVRAL